MCCWRAASRSCSRSKIEGVERGFEGGSLWLWNSHSSSLSKCSRMFWSCLCLRWKSPMLRSVKSRERADLPRSVI